MASLSRYEVLSPIGDNHYARFFKGYDVVGERDVCIIEFLEKFRKNEDRWREIWQQVLSAGRIKHDYMVNVYDYDKDRGWVITELMQGSLRDLPPDQLKSVELVRTVLYRTLETLDYLHANNHSHGDVRPATLLYDVAGQSKLSYSPGIVLGGQIPRRDKDYAFLPPELFDPSFGQVGVGVDLYGCGMSALNLLLGDEFAKKLLGVAVSDDVAWQRFHRDLNSHPSVRELLPSLPPDMEMVIQKLISKKVDQRFTTITEARNLLMRPAVEVKIQVAGHKASEPPKRTGGGPPPIFTAPPPLAGRPAPTPAKKPRPIRDWLNQKLKNPLVMGMCSAVIVGMAVIAIALISAVKELKKPIPVAFSSKPTGATIYIDGQKLEGVTDNQLPVKRGKHTLKLELTGYQSKETPIEIPFDKDKFEVPTIELAKATEKKPIEKPIEKPVVKPEVTPPKVAKWKLPEGFEPLGDEQDATAGLPQRVVFKGMRGLLQADDVPLSFVLLPKGQLTFGAAEPLEPGELAAQKVEIAAPFYVSQYEITRAQFAAYKRAQGGTEDSIEARNNPVVGVSAEDAAKFCRWLGAGCDLPTEQEWEWAVKGGSNRPFPWGEDSPAAEFVRLKLLEAPPSEGEPTVAVTEFERGKTAEGVHHLLGNVAEWCKEKYKPGFGESDKTTGAGKLHVIRGGSFRSPGSGPIRITWRANAPDGGTNDVGIRVVCHPVAPNKP